MVNIGVINNIQNSQWAYKMRHLAYSYSANFMQNVAGVHIRRYFKVLELLKTIGCTWEGQIHLESWKAVNMHKWEYFISHCMLGENDAKEQNSYHALNVQLQLALLQNLNSIKVT